MPFSHLLKKTMILVHHQNGVLPCETTLLFVAPKSPEAILTGACLLFKAFQSPTMMPWFDHF
jgi:hypothetical protein